MCFSPDSPSDDGNAIMLRLTGIRIKGVYVVLTNLSLLIPAHTEKMQTTYTTTAPRGTVECFLATLVTVSRGMVGGTTCQICRTPNKDMDFEHEYVQLLCGHICCKDCVVRAAHAGHMDCPTCDGTSGNSTINGQGRSGLSGNNPRLIPRAGTARKAKESSNQPGLFKRVAGALRKAVGGRQQADKKVRDTLYRALDDYAEQRSKEVGGEGTSPVIRGVGAAMTYAAGPSVPSR